MERRLEMMVIAKQGHLGWALYPIEVLGENSEN